MAISFKNDPTTDADDKALLDWTRAHSYGLVIILLACIGVAWDIARRSEKETHVVSAMNIITGIAGAAAGSLGTSWLRNYAGSRRSDERPYSHPLRQIAQYEDDRPVKPGLSGDFDYTPVNRFGIEEQIHPIGELQSRMSDFEYRRTNDA